MTAREWTVGLISKKEKPVNKTVKTMRFFFSFLFLAAVFPLSTVHSSSRTNKELLNLAKIKYVSLGLNICVSKKLLFLSAITLPVGF